MCPPLPSGRTAICSKLFPGAPTGRSATTKLSRFAMASASSRRPPKSTLVATNMPLPQSDITCLEERGVQYSVATEANMICVVIPGYVLPPGYGRAQADLLLRLSPGFPDVPPDMWWFDPAIRLADGRVV